MNIPTLLVIGILFLYMRKEVKQDIKELSEKVNNLDKRLIAVETILHMKEGAS